MLPYREHRFGAIAITLFFILLMGYAVYEFYSVALGPRITVPREVLVMNESFTVIRGTAENIAELKMNGHTISVTEAGIFEEPHLLNPGTNTVILDAKDNFGRTRRETIEILYTPSQGSSIITE